MGEKTLNLEDSINTPYMEECCILVFLYFGIFWYFGISIFPNSRISVWFLFKFISLFIGYKSALLKSTLGFHLLKHSIEVFSSSFLIICFYCLLCLLATTHYVLSPYVPSYLCWTFLVELFEL